MTDYEFELEVSAYWEVQAILQGRKRPGPSNSFLEQAKELQAQMRQITPEEMGWTSDAGT